MKDPRQARLERLARLTQALHQIEAAEAALASRAHDELQEAADDVLSFMDSDTQESGFLRELALAHSTRLGEKLKVSQDRLEQALAEAIESLAGSKSAENRLKEIRAERAKAGEQQYLEEAVDGYLSRGVARLAQEPPHK